MVLTMDVQLLEHLTLMRDTFRYDSRHCGRDMEQSDLLYREALHYEARIEELWKSYEGGPVVPARYRNAREGVDGRRAL